MCKESVYVCLISDDCYGGGGKLESLPGWVFDLFSYYTYNYYFYYLVREYAASLLEWVLYSENRFYKL